MTSNGSLRRAATMISGIAALSAPTADTLAQAGVAPKAATVDSAGLASTLDSLRLTIGATGASAAVIFPDGRTWTGVSGDAWSGSPVTPATVFDVGSITKSYTAALVLRLVGRGELALDDSVSRWIPDLPGAAGATIRHLLRQTSGLADYANHADFLPAIRSRMAAPWPPKENLRFVGEPEFAPGTRWRYSNTNYVALGLIAARVAERPFAELVRAELLDSLHLSSTFVAGEDTIHATRAHAYLDFTGDGKPDDLSAFVPDPATTRGAGGAGAIVSTAADVAGFARAYYTGAIVPRELQSEMTTWTDRGDGWKYGFGVIAAPNGDDLLLGHLGNTAGQSAGVWHSRTSGVTVAILTNAHAVRMAEPVRILLERALRSDPDT